MKFSYEPDLLNHWWWLQGALANVGKRIQPTSYADINYNYQGCKSLQAVRNSEWPLGLP